MKKAILLIVPLTITSLLASCGVKKCTVTFDSNGGTSVASQTVYQNETVCEPTKPTRTSSTEFTFQFEEWQLDGKKFDFNTPVTKNITLKAKWKENKHLYTVTFDSNGGLTEIDPQIIPYSEEARVTNPGPITRPDSSKYKYTFSGWHEVIDGEMKAEAFKFEDELVDHDILLKANWDVSSVTYLANATDTNTLKFLKNGKPLNDVVVIGGESFTFEMKAINVNPVTPEYIVPSSLQISIRGRPNLVDGYTVNVDKDDPTKATVIIDADKVVGTINIVGNAVKAGEFAYEAPYLFGLKPIASSSHTKDESNPLKIKFEIEESSSCSLPKDYNIYVQFDNCVGDEKVQWVSPSEDESYVSEYCLYDENTGELTIYSKHINNSIKIVARANNYNLLDELDWKNENESVIDIEDVSFSGLAPYVFYLGEEKTIKMNGIEHQVRIIDFDHDLDQNNNPVGITFEFADLIHYGSEPEESIWDRGSTNYYFCTSILNHFLNSGSNCIFYNMEEDLRDVIKTVNKKVGLQKTYTTNFPYTTKLFPLSYEEIGGNQTSEGYAKGEGEAYSFYKDLSEDELEKRRIKKDGLDIPTHTYWLRSPVTSEGKSNIAWSVFPTGDLNNSDNISTITNSVAPAFCV